jgi:hypothetical protein
MSFLRPTGRTCMTENFDVPTRELARRQSDGIDVRLLWSPQTNGVFVAVDDEHDGESFVVEIDPANALDAYDHPFVYADELAGLPVTSSA